MCLAALEHYSSSNRKGGVRGRDIKTANFSKKIFWFGNLVLRKKGQFLGSIFKSFKNFSKVSLLSIYLLLCSSSLDSSSVSTFLAPGMEIAVTQTFLFKEQFYMSFVKLSKSMDSKLPILLIEVTVNVLSIFKKIWQLRCLLHNDFNLKKNCF